jgi:hypothetical protein
MDDVKRNPPQLKRKKVRCFVYDHFEEQLYIVTMYSKWELWSSYDRTWFSRPDKQEI